MITVLVDTGLLVRMMWVSQVSYCFTRKHRIILPAVCVQNHCIELNLIEFLTL